MMETIEPRTVGSNYLSFRVSHQWYAVNVDHVIEVLHMIALTELPKTPPDILGLMTLRDVVMPVVDLRLRFGYDRAPLDLNTPIIAANTSAGAIGMVVDDVDNIEAISQITNYEGKESVYVMGAARMLDRLLLLLNIDRLRGEVQRQTGEMPAVKTGTNGR
jgi:purine-binding chemotaxis protein CheW